MTLLTSRIFITQKITDITPHAKRLIDAIRKFTSLSIDALAITKVYQIQKPLSPDQLSAIAEHTLIDPIIESASLTEDNSPIDSDWIVEVSLKPGLTDNAGKTVQLLIEDYLGVKFEKKETVTAITRYHLNGTLTLQEVTAIATEFFANPLIETIFCQPKRPWLVRISHTLCKKVGQTVFSRFQSISAEKGLKPCEKSGLVKAIDLNIDDDALMALSQKRCLALTLLEMQTLKRYFSESEVIEKRAAVGLSDSPTDVEIEALAQTWSEHCKHKIFHARIDYTEGTKKEMIDSLFATYIRAATAKLAPNCPWLVSVFDDNAGIIRLTDQYLLAYKVETHNTPSALDPYGGALTGILGVNRDILGAGKGARLLANTDVFCFAPPNYSQPLPAGLLHPKRILEGVRRGVEHGGNKSGVPTVNGALLFDDRYLGKPLVYCGTVGIMPAQINGLSAAKKEIHPGDHIVIIGGRTGKDGIHGATLSSETLTLDSPTSLVQIGDPFTQKKLTDFLLEARDHNLFRAVTDNGAGGFSSSIGELAELSNGCEIHLNRALLKDEFLKPWEILVSESQERMTLAVPQESVDPMRLLALKHEVDIVSIGLFTDTGMFHIVYNDQTVAFLSLSFLHHGNPQMHYSAVFNPKEELLFQLPKSALSTDLHQLLRRYNVCSKEVIVRQYDHEVQGATVLKPLQGKTAEGPGDAAVILPRETWAEKIGIVLANGICPKWSDFDPYHMAANAIDEAIRNAVAVGCDPESIAILDNFCWPDPTSDSHRMGQLVRAAKGLYDYAVAFKTPIISGKDSMKNGYKQGAIEIAIPPTLLISALGKIPDISKAVSMDVKCAGDLIYIIGITKQELGGSEYAAMHQLTGGVMPKVNANQARENYAKVHAAIEQGWVASCHDCSDGGLAVCLVESALAGNLGVEIDLNAIPQEEITEDRYLLFSESASRLVITVDPQHATKIDTLFSPLSCGCIGKVIAAPEFIVRGNLTRISHQPLGKLETSVFPNIPSNSLGNVYEHSLRESLEISKKQTVQP
ncbi:MAG: phosphoribosylformylglycinamidine synthase subunit PurL, partial [Chlamydiota bacterium]